MAARGAQKCPTESGKWSTHRFLGAPLLLNKFFDQSTPSVRKGRDREKKIIKITAEIVATTLLPLPLLMPKVVF